MTTTHTDTPRVGSRDEWLKARKALLQQEKEITHKRDEVARARRALPMVRVEKEYTFAPTAPSWPTTSTACSPTWPPGM